MQCNCDLLAGCEAIERFVRLAQRHSMPSESACQFDRLLDFAGGQNGFNASEGSRMVAVFCLGFFQSTERFL